jgi:hypothetical protein
MSSWLIRPQTLLRAVLRVTLALVTTAFPRLLIIAGGADLLTWIRAHSGNQYYYVEYWSLGAAGWVLLVGMISVLPTEWVLIHSEARLRWL